MVGALFELFLTGATSISQHDACHAGLSFTDVMNSPTHASAITCTELERPWICMMETNTMSWPPLRMLSEVWWTWQAEKAPEGRVYTKTCPWVSFWCSSERMRLALGSAMRAMCARGRASHLPIAWRRSSATAVCISSCIDTSRPLFACESSTCDNLAPCRWWNFVVDKKESGLGEASTLARRCSEAVLNVRRKDDVTDGAVAMLLNE